MDIMGPSYEHLPHVSHLDVFRDRERGRERERQAARPKKRSAALSFEREMDGGFQAAAQRKEVGAKRNRESRSGPGSAAAPQPGQESQRPGGRVACLRPQRRAGPGRAGRPLRVVGLLLPRPAPPPPRRPRRSPRVTHLRGMFRYRPTISRGRGRGGVRGAAQAPQAAVGEGREGEEGPRRPRRITAKGQGRRRRISSPAVTPCPAAAELGPAGPERVAAAVSAPSPSAAFASLPSGLGLPRSPRAKHGPAASLLRLGGGASGPAT